MTLLPFRNVVSVVVEVEEFENRSRFRTCCNMFVYVYNFIYTGILRHIASDMEHTLPVYACILSLLLLHTFVHV